MPSCPFTRFTQVSSSSCLITSSRIQTRSLLGFQSLYSGLRLCSASWQLQPTTQKRLLMLRPEGTVSPDRFPEGYIPLSGNETIDVMFEMVKDGHFICPINKLETAHAAFTGISRLVEKEFPINRRPVMGGSASSSILTTQTVDDLVFQQHKKKEYLSLILIKRDFWVYDDFNDSRENTSFGLQNQYFDNYQWSAHLYIQFQSFVERWYPADLHTHLTYREYLSLILYFAVQVKGVSMSPLLPKGTKIKPNYLVPFPARAAREPIALFGVWLQYFKAPLMIKKLLVVRGGCGVIGMMARYKGIPIVRVTDPSPIAIEGGKKDAERFGFMYRNMSFVVSGSQDGMFPQDTFSRSKKQPTAVGKAQLGINSLINEDDTSGENYNCVVFHADLPILRGLSDGDAAVSDENRFAPGLQGYARDLELFFEKVGRQLDRVGCVAIITSNIYSLAYPDKPNPIEFEVKVNRRFVIMDYYDRPMVGNDAAVSIDQWSPTEALGTDGTLSMISKALKKKLRSELWILHKIEAIPDFGWIHGIPGATPPLHVLKFWNRKKMRNHRKHMMKQQVELHGGDWGDFKSRMLRVLQDSSLTNDDDDDDGESVRDMEEDDEAVQVRMALDPTYPAVLARRAFKSQQRKRNNDLLFHDQVGKDFGGINTSDDEDDISDEDEGNTPITALSPREDFDRWASEIRIALKDQHSQLGQLGYLGVAPSISIVGTERVPMLSEVPYTRVATSRASYETQEVGADESQATSPYFERSE